MPSKDSLHEAGHAVVCRALGAEVGFIERSYCHVAAHNLTAEQLLIYTAAGWVAEAVSEEENPVDSVLTALDNETDSAGPGSDGWYFVKNVCKLRRTGSAQTRLAHRLVSQAVELVQEHWDEIVQIAERLDRDGYVNFFVKPFDSAVSRAS